jgi:hypothetical protein
MLYEELCKGVHASPYAIKTQTRIFVDPQGRRLNWLVYHDDSTEQDRYDLAQRFVTGIESDLFILIVFAQALVMKFPDLEMTGWKTKTDAFFKLLELEKERIKQTDK